MTGGRSLAILAAAYLLGSIPWSYLIVRLTQGVDVRTVGSGNVGATNAMRAGGKKVGIAALVLDTGKGIAAVLVARALGAPPVLVGGAAMAVVLGHVFPVFLGFRGGKGVATAAGVLGALEPRVMAAGLAVFVLLVVWKRFVSLGSVVVAGLFPVLAWIGQRLGWTERDPGVLYTSVAIGAVVIARHRLNIVRLLQGTERRLGEPRSRPSAAVEAAGGGEP